MFTCPHSDTYLKSFSLAIYAMFGSEENKRGRKIIKEYKNIFFFLLFGNEVKLERMEKKLENNKREYCLFSLYFLEKVDEK